MRVAAFVAGAWLLGALAGCAGIAPMPPASDLLHDELFAAPSEAVDPHEALAVSPAMRRYLADHGLTGVRHGDRRRRLVDALYRNGELQLEYEATFTRSAAQAFDARSGNCLALVLMTGALARELGLSVQYQLVAGDEAWDRAGGLFISVGHVNLTLGDRPAWSGAGFVASDALIVDFMPAARGRLLRTRPLAERTVVAMFLNNRAVEALTAGRVDDAYAWSRAAVVEDPELLASYLTLGVIYRERNRPDLADAALQRVLARAPDDLSALKNRMVVLRDLGRTAEADALAQRLRQLDPHPPFSYFERGLAAWRERRFDAARRLFEKEVARAPYQHEFEFWLAVTYLELKDTARATAHLARAIELTTTRRDHDLYAAKLSRLKALAAQAH